METIYLIQPLEFINTNTYKIGRSSKNDLSRCKNGYKPGTRFLCIFECTNSQILENNIKKQFNELFKLSQGLEYFEGDEKQMCEEFIRLVGEHKNMNKDDTNIIDDKYKDDKYKDDKYKDDKYKDDKYKEDKKPKVNSKTSKMYVCDKCKKIWKNKTDFTRHVNKKIPCADESLLQKIIELEKKNIELEKKNIELEKKNIELEKKNMEIMFNIINKQNNITNNITNNNQQTVNIIVSPTEFGKEDLSFINSDVIKNILNKGCKAIQELIQVVHFNPDKSEYHNIYLPNWRDKTNILVFDGFKWNLKNKDEILNNLKNKGIEYIKKKYDELDINDKKDAKIIKKIKRFLDSYDNDKKNNILKNDLLLILYNNRDLIEKTRKISNKQLDK